MKYDFDEIIPRRGTHCVKWDSDTNDRTLPMWVADMDFRTAPPVVEALERRLRHGVFGYTKIPDTYFEAIGNWFDRRYDFAIRREWILPTTNVVAALSVIVKALTEPGNRVILQTPAYNCFFSVLERTGREPIANPLLCDERGNYRIDFEDLAYKAAYPETKLLFLCNPHNPTGRSWTPEELIRIGEICLRNDVTVVSDEIHCDLTLNDRRHTPFASLDERFLSRSITCTAPTKTFNLAGLQVANIVAPDAGLRRKIETALVNNELSSLNVFGIEALIAAYNEGEEWLAELKKYIATNYEYLREFFTKYHPALTVTPLEATYLVWIDCRSLQRSSSEISALLQQEGPVRINEGIMYQGEGYMRINIACPRAQLIEGLKRIHRVLRSIS